MGLFATGLLTAQPHLAAALDDHSRFGQALVCIAVGDSVALRRTLQLAHADGDEALQRLLNTPGAGGNTLLMHAVQLQGRDALRVLLLAGADPNVVNLRGQTALHLAAQRGEAAALNAAAALLSHDANLEAAADGLTSLLLAARFASGDMLQLLLARGAKVHAVSAEGRSVVTMAVLASNVPALQVVLEHLRATSHLLVADTQDAEGWTALHWACAVGDVEILELLLEQSPINTCLRTLAGETVLHLAAREGDMAVLGTLLTTRPARQAGQLLTMALVRTEGEQTAEDYAVDAGHFACGTLILERIQELRSMLTHTGADEGAAAHVHRNMTVPKVYTDDGSEDTGISPDDSDVSRSAGTVSLPRLSARCHTCGSGAELDASATSDSAQYSASSGTPSPSHSSAIALNEAAGASAGSGAAAATVMTAVLGTSAAGLSSKQQGRTPSSSSSTESSNDSKAEAKRKRRREAWHRREELKRREQAQAHSSVAQLEGEQQALQQVVAALVADRNRLLQLFNSASGGHMQLLRSVSPKDSGMGDADNNDADAEAPTLMPVDALYSTTTLESMV